MDRDYVIIKDDKTPLCFESGYVVIYGDKEDAVNDTIASDWGIVEVEYEDNTATLYWNGDIIGWFEYDTDNEDDYEDKLKESIAMAFMS